MASIFSYKEVSVKYILTFLLLLSVSLNASADDGAMKQFNIGVGSYASVIAYDNTVYDDDRFAGLSVSFGYAATDQFALRATYFTLDHDDFSDFESKGLDLLAYLGTGLATHGFKAYVGGGIFTDKWQIGRYSETFNGLQLSGGIGYNWDSLALDFILGIRDASEYEDFINRGLPVNVSAAAVSGTLLLSYRF
jgi:hypothetical protein